MKISVCDRCGKQYYPPHPMQNCILPYYTIKKTTCLPYGTIDVDLCDECIEQFKNWLDMMSQKEGEN